MLNGSRRRARVAIAAAALLLPLAAQAQETRKPGEVVGPISMLAPDWPEMIELARILRPGWEKLGVKVNVQHVTLNSLTAQATGEHNAPQMTANGWGGAPDRIDPDFFITELFHSKRAVKGGSNYGNYRNADYDKLVDAQRAEMDEGKRLEMVREAQRILYRDKPGMVLYYIDYLNAYRTDRIDGVVPVMGSGISLPYIPWTYFDAKPKGSRKLIKTTTQYDIATLNPFATGEVQNASMLRWIYAPFVMRDKDLNPVPWAAESWKIVDPQTVDVTIRVGMKFHDGKPVTIEDVKFTFDFFEKWKFPSYARFTDNIEKVEVTGERTVRFHLKRPYAPFVTNILGYAFIAPKHIWEKIGAEQGLKSPADWPNDQAIGYGPFKLAQWKKDEYLRLSANKSWFHPPQLSDVYWLIVPSIDSQIGMLEGGEADMMAWNVTPAQLKRLKQTPNIDARSAPSHAPREIRFNIELPPFDDVAVRTAFSLATDRKQLVNTLLDGAATPGNDAYVSPKLAWSDPALKVPEFDIEAARAVLRKAGYFWDSEGRLHYPK